MNFNTTCLTGCQPIQILNINIAINDMSTIVVYNTDGCAYSNDDIKFSYSLDGVCWSCYGTFDDILANTAGLTSDFFIKVKVPGSIGGITIDGEAISDYTTSLDSGFNFTTCDGTTVSSNTWNPYANIEYAVQLQTQLSENVACMTGIPIYYFKVNGVTGAKDITFKEYAITNVTAVKQIKLLIADGTMPSSKPEFTDFGLDWQTDWETEITKGMFATAFGTTAQPTEGDLIYVPMMKRMWMVNEAYDEKNGYLMWQSTTFKLSLVKYQEKASLDLGNVEDLVNDFVKNKYEDLFGDEEVLDSGVEGDTLSQYEPNNLYSVYESDSTRKYVSCDEIDYAETSLYYENVLISDLQYKILDNTAQIVYQRNYCGDTGVCSFIFKPSATVETGTFCKIANISLTYTQDKSNITLTLLNNPSNALTLAVGQTYFVYMRWSKKLNNIELVAAQYVWNENVPVYKLQPQHYKFDIDNAAASISKYNIEMTQETKKPVILYGCTGTVTNFKLFNDYIDDVNEILEMYPTNQHLLINDTARKLIDLNGVQLR